jgi:hypothetical protein
MIVTASHPHLAAVSTANGHRWFVVDGAESRMSAAFREAARRLDIAIVAPFEVEAVSFPA